MTLVMPGTLAHVCLPEQVEHSIATGHPIYAMCGIEWVPTKLDSTSPVCDKCNYRLAQGWRFTPDGLPAQPGPHIQG